MTDATKLFIERARDVSLTAVVDRLALRLKKHSGELVGPCPVCGGKDRFSVNPAKGVFNCRGCGKGGHDAIGLAAHVLSLDVSHRADFLEACGRALGESVPDEAEQLTQERRREIEAEQARLAEERAAREAEAEADRSAFREKELAKCRGIYERGERLTGHGNPAELYLARRSGLGGGFSPHLRFEAALTYWHGRDERDNPVALFSGPALLTPFLDGEGQLIGLHQTWIDLGNPPKFRPLVYASRGEAAPAGRGTGRDGQSALRPSDEEMLPTKKMRGSKSGGLLPVAGVMGAARWVVAEGIENVAAYAALERRVEPALFAATFYAAAGDIHNLAGPGLRSGSFAHPDLTKTDAKGRTRAVRMPSPEPDPHRLADGFPLLPHVEALLLIADGDSEAVWTATLMARALARARLMVPGIAADTLWPPAGHDFADMQTQLSSSRPSEARAGIHADEGEGQ